MPPPPAPSPISPNICRACITLIDRTAHPTCSTSGPALPCAACTLRGSPCEPVPTSLQLQLTDLIYFHARWRTACAGPDKAIATKMKKELTANVMDFIELLDEDKAGKAGGDGDATTKAEVGVLVPAVPAKPVSAAAPASKAAVKTTKANSAPAATNVGKKRANDDSQVGGAGLLKKPKPNTARAPKPKTPAPPKQVKAKASSPEKVEKAQKAARKSSPVVRQKQAPAAPPPQASLGIPVASVNASAVAPTVMPTSPPRDERTSYPLSTPEIAAMGRPHESSDLSSSHASTNTASTVPLPENFMSEYLDFDVDFHNHTLDHPHMPLPSSDTAPSFHSAGTAPLQLGPAFTDGNVGVGNAADAFHMSDMNTNTASHGRGGEHDVSMAILEQLRTMNATLGGMYELMKYQAQAQAGMSSAANGGHFQS